MADSQRQRVQGAPADGNGPDPEVRKSIETNLALLDHYDQLLTDLELHITRTAKVHDPNAFHRLRSVPGIGKILARVILYEIHDIGRFPRVQDFVSYCRLVKCAKLSDGKHYGYSGKKIGNAHLKWAFSEAAVLFLREHLTAQRYLAKQAHKHGTPKALTILAHKRARAVYYMLSRHQAFAAKKFFDPSADSETYRLRPDAEKSRISWWVGEHVRPRDRGSTTPCVRRRGGEGHDDPESGRLTSSRGTAEPDV